MTDHHSDQQLARGFLFFCRQRGSCEIRGRGANLWYTAAKALGFDVETIRCPDSAFVEQLSGFVRVLSLWQRPTRLPDIIFSDIGSFPTGPDSTEYWHKWTTPHLFYDHMGLMTAVWRGHCSGFAGAGVGLGA